MTGIIDRIQSAVGSDYAKIAEFAHQHFQERLTHHGHFGRAAVETVAEVCRRHPAVVGLGAGLLVDRLLVAEAHHHDAKLKAADPTLAPVPAPAEAASDKPQKKRGKAKAAEPIRLTHMKPGRIAFEVFGGLLLLKMAASGAKIFRHKHQSEVWFAPAAKIHLFSATLCAYNLSKALRSKNVSAWRNGAVLFFGTDAIKPVLKWYRTHPAQPKPVAEAPATEAQPTVQMTPPASPQVMPPLAAVAAAAPVPTPAQQARAAALTSISAYSPGAPAQPAYAAADPTLEIAQALAGMMKPGDRVPTGGGPNLLIVN